MKLYLLFITILFFSKALLALETPHFNGIDVRFIRDTFEKTPHHIDSITKANQDLYLTINQVEPFQSIHHQAKYGDKILYDQTYEVGEFGFRVIPQRLYSSAPKKHLIVAGDSNVFGIGVKDQDTLPVILAGAKKDYHPYNFGIRGGGPHSTLALMEFFPWEIEIQESTGYFIYNYYDFLIDRVIGSKGYIAWNDGDSPNYQLNDKDEAEYSGDFKDRFITKLYKFVLSKKWLDEMLPTLPRYRPHHTILVSKIFLKMKQLYLNKVPNGKFVVAINYSFPEMVPGRLDELQRELKKDSIDTIILPNRAFGENFKLVDGHLSPEGHKTEADLIIKNLPQL